MSTSLEDTRAFLRGKKRAKGRCTYNSYGELENVEYAGLCVCCGRYVKDEDLGGRGRTIFDTNHPDDDDHVWMVCNTETCIDQLQPPCHDIVLWECDACGFYPQIGDSVCICCQDAGDEDEACEDQ